MKGSAIKQLTRCTKVTKLTMYNAGGGVDGHANSAGDAGHGMGTGRDTKWRYERQVKSLIDHYSLTDTLTDAADS